MLFGRPLQRVYLWCEPVDMRKSFAGLIALTRTHLHEYPMSGDVFVFLNRDRSYLKALFWDRSGFCILAKKLEKTRVTVRGSGKIELSKELFLLVFDGVNT